VNRLPVSPLVSRGLDIAEKYLGLHSLCEKLGAPEMLIRAWRFGHAEMPHGKFMLLVDVLTELDPNWSNDALRPARVKRILIVDDHPDTAESLAALLELDGHDTLPITDAREAVTVAKKFQPQLALLDLRMPRIDGVQLARLFRADPELRHTCLVAITAETEDQYREATRRAGFDAYLRKPVDLMMLRSIVAQFD
jgi:CheY-like chemotaxis protein